VVAIQVNQIRVGRDAAVQLRQGSLVSPGAGSLQALIANIVIRSAEPGEQRSDGIVLDGYDGTLAFDVLHNTVVDAWKGVDVFASDGVSLGGTVRGNLFSDLGYRGLIRPASGVSDSQNLYFQTSDLPAEVNANSIFADPRFKRAPEDLHLAADSPAIDVSIVPLLTVMTSYGLEALDGDGLRRVKRANASAAAFTLDLGALEAGDETVLHEVAAVAPGLTSAIDQPALNGFPNAAPQITPNWNPDSANGIYNDHPVSAQYLSGSARWRLRQEDLAPFSDGARFNLFAPGSGNGRFIHTNLAGNTAGSYTQLDDASVNNREDAILLVTRNPGSGTIVDVVSPLSVFYFSGVWSVYRADGFVMPDIGGFNVYAQPPSVNAFRHRAVAANISFNTTELDHPLLNGSRCARSHVTQATDLGVVNNHHIGVYYTGGGAGRWAIFNQDAAAMPVGAQFHIVVDPQASACPVGIFADGFEG
jgi:hypothetical protein